MTTTEAMMANPRFQNLVRSRATLGWTLTVIMLVIYFGFILLVAFDKELLSKVVAGTTISLGIFVGLGVLVSAFVLVALYVTIANSKFDAMTRALREEVGE